MRRIFVWAFALVVIGDVMMTIYYIWHQQQNQSQMYKVGVMMMGKSSTESPSKVKEVILEVEAKTKVVNIFEYLLELKKIKDMNVSVSLEKGGERINQTSNISQILKYTRPVNGIIKLFLYTQDQNSNINTSKMSLKLSRHEIANNEHLKKKDKEPEERIVREEHKQSGFCCC